MRQIQKLGSISMVAPQRKPSTRLHSAKLGKLLLKRPVVIVSAFALIGVTALVLSHASVPSFSIEAENGTVSSPANTIADASASGGTAVRFGSVRRFFADDASWNKTVSQMGGEYTELKNSAIPNNDFAKRLWDYGGGTVSGSPAGNFFLDLKDYSIPIYDVATATTTAQVYQVNWSQNQQSFSQSGITQGDSIPWNPNWKPGTGNDAHIEIVNYKTGKVYSLWGVGQLPINCVDFFGPNGLHGFDINNPNHICIASINTYDNLYTASDTNNTTSLDRGMGINKLALVVRADEVLSGAIRHALPLTTSNPMFGPGSETPGVNPQPVYSTSGGCQTLVSKGVAPAGAGMITQKYNPLSDLSAAGYTKGFYLKPATRLEHEFGYIGGTLTNGCVTVAPTTDIERSKTNPSGMRFALNISYADIDAWIATKSSWSAEKKRTARIFAVAWKDYGAIIAETGGWGIGIESDGIIDPVSKAKWASLGLPDDTANLPQPQSSSDLFAGLLTRDRLYVVKPPQ